MVAPARSAGREPRGSVGRAGCPCVWEFRADWGALGWHACLAGVLSAGCVAGWCVVGRPAVGRWRSGAARVREFLITLWPSALAAAQPPNMTLASGYDIDVSL